MVPYEVDLEGPEPVHEAAYSQVVKTILAYKRQVDNMLASPRGIVANLALPEIKRRNEFKTLATLWERDENFRVYLKRALASKFGNEYAKGLIGLFFR